MYEQYFKNKRHLFISNRRLQMQPDVLDNIDKNNYINLTEISNNTRRKTCNGRFLIWKDKLFSSPNALHSSTLDI